MIKCEKCDRALTSVLEWDTHMIMHNTQELLEYMKKKW